MSKTNLCMNCLADGACTVSLGPVLGSQYDSYQQGIQLCTPCEEALVAGDLVEFHQLYKEERVIRRGGHA